MQRRTFLTGGAAALGVAGSAFGQPPTSDDPRDWTDRAAEAEARIFDDFPFPKIAVTGKDALARWETLNALPGDRHVIVGGRTDIISVGETMGLYFPAEPQSTPAQILAAADKLQHPQALSDLAMENQKSYLAFLDEQLSHPDKLRNSAGVGFVANQQSTSAIRESLEKQRDATAAIIAAGRLPNEPGDWPAVAEPMTSTSLIDWQTARPLPEAYIIRLPTSDWTEIPAHLRMGGWNACPPAEYHVAAFRSWRDRYGAELVHVGGSTVDIRVKRRPQTRDEALALADELFLYCEDIIVQGYGDPAPLAAALMAGDWWNFWWD
jgi:Domain of unknown function (DUF4253)